MLPDAAVLSPSSVSSLFRLPGRVLDRRRCIRGEGGLGEGDLLPGEDRPGDGGLLEDPLKDPERLIGVAAPLALFAGDSGEGVFLGVMRGPCLSGRARKVLSALILENAEDDGVESGR